MVKYPLISEINANKQNPLKSSFEALNYYMSLKAPRAKTDNSIRPPTFKHHSLLLQLLLRHSEHRKKTEPVRTATKNRTWSLQKFGKFCNYLNFKDAYRFLSGDKIFCCFYFNSYPWLGHLISRTLSINVIGYTKNSRVSFANRVSKTKKKQDKNAGANQKGYAATAANCCTRIFVSVISPWFV